MTNPPPSPTPVCGLVKTVFGAGGGEGRGGEEGRGGGEEINTTITLDKDR